MDPRTKNNELTVNEEIEILSAEVEANYRNDEYSYNEYHIVFPEEL